MTNLTEEQLWFVRHAIAEWLRICEQHSYVVRPPDASHSALLGRLLSGKAALPEPPPRRFSYPDYDLAEGKPVQVIDVHEALSMFPGRVSIDQCPDWERVSSAVMRHVPTGHLYSLTGATLQRIAEP